MKKARKNARGNEAKQSNAATRERRIRRTWFDRGAQAFARSFPGRKYGYPCPLCELLFCPAALEHDLLSREDVPPRSLRVGGGKVILTCRPCNSDAGADLDSEMRKAEQLLDFAQGLPTKGPIDARLIAGGHLMRIDLEQTPDTVRMVGIPKANHPEAVAGQIRHMDLISSDAAEIPRELTLRFPPFRPQRAVIGWLRAAYLAVFAKLGYCYAFHPSLLLVRQQIREFDKPLVPCFAFQIESPAASFSMTWVEHPEELVSILVVMGRHGILLPRPDVGATKLYDYTASVQDKAMRTSFRGKILPWPTGPEFNLDFFEPH